MRALKTLRVATSKALSPGVAPLQRLPSRTAWHNRQGQQRHSPRHRPASARAPDLRARIASSCGRLPERTPGALPRVALPKPRAHLFAWTPSGQISELPCTPFNPTSNSCQQWDRDSRWYCVDHRNVVHQQQWSGCSVSGGANSAARPVEAWWSGMHAVASRGHSAAVWEGRDGGQRGHSRLSRSTLERWSALQLTSSGYPGTQDWVEPKQGCCSAMDL